MGWPSDEEEFENAKHARNLHLADDCSDSHAERSDGRASSLMLFCANAGVSIAFAN